MILKHTVKTVGDAPPIRILSLEGVVDNDGEALDYFEDILDSALQPYSGQTVIDLTRVDAISEIGWEVLIDKAHDHLKNQCQLRIAGMQPLVHSMFRIMEVKEIIAAHHTVDEAITAARLVPVLS